MRLRFVLSFLADCLLLSNAFAEQLHVQERSFIIEVAHPSFLPGVRRGASDIFPVFFNDHEVQISHEYASTAFSGLSFHCQTTDSSFPWERMGDILGAISGVVRVWDTMSYYQHGAGMRRRSTSESDPSLANDEGLVPVAQEVDVRVNAVHETTGVSKLHARSLSGKGVRIALVDGGVDYLHPALGGGFGSGFKIDYGWDFVGDNVRPPLKENPDADPFGDCSDHATHTAGILFANDTATGFSGVAPGAGIELYRVFDCNGMSTSDVVLRAVLKAYERGVDLINLSLGSGSRPFSDDPLAALVARINREGRTFIITGAGNSGRDGTYSAAAPEGGGPDLFSVGSVDVEHIFSVLRPGKFVVSDTEPRLIRNFTWNPPTWTAWWRSNFPEAITMVLPASEDPQADELCQQITKNAALYHDKIVLVRRGGCTLKAKMENLVRAGGQYVLIYNNLPGLVFDLEVRLDGITGAGSLDAETGETLVALLKAGSNIELEMDSNFTSPAIIRSRPNTQTADRVSTFSTWGPSGEGHFVPTLLGPGGRVLSTLPRQRGGFGIQSGTSMAVPYITGCIALLKEAFPDISGRDVGKMLVSTAVPVPFGDGTATQYPFLASAWQQGAGRVDAFRAFQTKTVVNVTSLAFNDTEFSTGPQSFVLSNTGNQTAEYEITNVPAVTVLSLSDDPDDPSPVPFSPDQKSPEATSRFLETLRPTHHAEVEISVSGLLLEPGQTTTIQVSPKIESMGGLAGRCPLYSGYVLLNSSRPLEYPDLVIPYGGIACQVRSMPTLAVSRNTTFLAAATREEASMASFRSRVAGAQHLRQLPPGYHFRLAKIDDPSDAESYASLVLPTIQVELSMYTRAINFELLPQGLHELESIPLFSSDLQAPVGGFGRVEILFRHWTGLLLNGSWVAPGQYRIRVSTLRLFGDPHNTDDFVDHVVTDHFRISYIDPNDKYAKMVEFAKAVLRYNTEPCPEYSIM